MPEIKYDYRFSTNEPERHIAVLNREIKDFCHNQPLREARKERLISRLLRRTGAAAFNGATKGEGGPFGAMLVDFHTADGIPQVVGFGANHVVPSSDPTAHAEMTAIRNAVQRLGHTDLSELTLVTSCECCPMCLSAATGCKVEKIYFAATRAEAAKAGFLDNDQYRLMKEGGIEQHARKAGITDNARERLAGHDAAVEIPHNGKTYSYYGDAGDSADPTNLPVLQAVRKATAGLAALRSQESGKPEVVFHPPAGTVIISKDKPHPLSLVAADWARIGRRRGADPANPLDDLPQKNTGQILYLNDSFERMPVRDAAGKTSEVPVDRIWQEIREPQAVHVEKELGAARLIAFGKWEEMFKRTDAGEKRISVQRY